MITAIFLFLANGTGAVPVEEWNRTFGGEYGDAAFSVAQTPDEGYILAGSTYFNDSSDHEDAWLIKTDSEGHEQWNRTYPAKWIAKVSTTRHGGYILRGVSNYSDFWLMGTDAYGQEQWNRTINVKNITYFIDIEETSDGGSIIAALENMASSENPFLWNSRLVKVDAVGNEQWNNTFKRPHEFEVRSVQQTSDGGYVLTGSTFYSYGSYLLPGIPLMDYGDSDIVLIKTDVNGSKQWEKTFGWWGEREGAISVIQTGDRGYMIKGIKAGRLSDGPGDHNVWLVKTDASGNEQWNRDFRKSWGPLFSSVAQTTDGGYIFTSSTKYETDEIHDWLIKTDANGNLQWKKVLEGAKMDEARLKLGGYSIKEISDHGYILAGSIESYGAGNSDALLVKIRDTSASALGTTAEDIDKSNKKSMPGFEILGAMVSTLMLFLLMRKRK